MRLLSRTIWPSLFVVFAAVVGLVAWTAASGEELARPVASVVRDPLPPHADLPPLVLVSWHPPPFDWNAQVRWWGGVAFRLAGERAIPARSARRPTSVLLPAPRASAPAPTGLDGVLQCIKDHESGNYSESSHPGAGSGAYQFIPGTWRAWSARAGYPGYDYAYEAPPSVQDAVTAYTLTHGGAHNWDSSYGNDPCTEGMP